MFDLINYFTNYKSCCTRVINRILSMTRTRGLIKYWNPQITERSIKEEKKRKVDGYRIRLFVTQHFCAVIVLEHFNWLRETLIFQLNTIYGYLKQCKRVRTKSGSTVFELRISSGSNGNPREQMLIWDRFTVGRVSEDFQLNPENLFEYRIYIKSEQMSRQFRP